MCSLLRDEKQRHYEEGEQLEARPGVRVTGGAFLERKGIPDLVGEGC